MGDDGGAEPAEVEPELVIDLLVGPVVGIDVVGGPDHLVAQFPGQFQGGGQLLHLPLHDSRVVVVVVVVGPVEVQNLDSAPVPSEVLGTAVRLEFHFHAPPFQGFRQKGSVGIVPLMVGGETFLLVVVEGDAQDESGNPIRPA